MQLTHTPSPRRFTALSLVAASIATVFLLQQACAVPDARSEPKPVGAQPAWSLPATGMPLGTPGARQSSESTAVAEGVTYYRLQRGAPSADDFWTANIGFRADDAVAREDMARLVAAGFTPRLDPSTGSHADGGSLGTWVSVGRFATRAEAESQAAAIAKATNGRYKPRTRYTGLAGFPTTGPWLVHVLAIQPSRASVTMTSTLPHGDTPGTADLGNRGETPSAASARLEALAVTNGGFFTDITPDTNPDRTPARSPVGTYVGDGRYLVAPLGGRSAVRFRNDGSGHPDVSFLHDLTGEIAVQDADGGRRPLTGVDRPILGYVVNCGAPANQPLPQQDLICRNDDDLVMYDGLYLEGKASNRRVHPAYVGATFELRVAASGTVVSGDSTLGAAPPPGGYVLQGLGRSADWLKAHAAPGTRLTVARSLKSGDAAVDLRPSDTIVEAGPTLLGAGVDPANILERLPREGFATRYAGSSDANWYNDWVTARNSRTAIGTAADGTILLVVIDGRLPATSLGTSIPETAAVMAWLGAVEALNLDGGGSSNMIVNGRSVGHPSDASGERGVGNNVVVLPR